MIRIRAAIFALCLFLSLGGCALQAPNHPQATPEPAPVVTPEPTPVSPAPTPEPDPAPTDPTPEPEPIPEPLPEPVFSAVDRTDVTYLGGTPVTITRPEVELQSTAAAEVINQYFTMLSGKVRDYAEGDLAPMPGVTYTVTAGHRLTYVSDTALSFLWTVETTTSSPELPGSTTVSAVTFDPGSGALLTFRDLFGGNAGKAADLFIAQARTVIAQREANYYYFEDWNELAATALDETCFYLAEEGVCVFYSREALGTHTEVLLTWDALSGCFAITP